MESSMIETNPYQNIYILKNKRVYKCKDTKEWTKWFENIENRKIKQEITKNGYFISTVFLGINHDFQGKGKPIVFETMVFDLLSNSHWSDVDMHRYSSYKKALQGHLAAVRWWKEQDVFKRVPLHSLNSFIGEMISKFNNFIEKIKNN
jgi:hypothetical protein